MDNSWEIYIPAAINLLHFLTNLLVQVFPQFPVIYNSDIDISTYRHIDMYSTAVEVKDGHTIRVAIRRDIIKIAPKNRGLFALTTSNTNRQDQALSPAHAINEY